MERLRQLIVRAGLNSHIVLLALLLVVGGVWGFVELVDEVKEGDTHQFDVSLVQAMRRADDPSKPIGPDWLEGIGRDITAIGGVAVLTLVTAAVLGYLLLVRKFHAMWLVLVASVGATIISSVLKYVIGRPRPDVVPHLHDVYTYSFPSGHSMMSSAIYLTLGALLARLVPERRAKVYFLALALVATLLIGVSRVYLGVHYPTDVLAGWTAGLAWALLCWLVARSLQRHGKVEKDTEEAPEPGARTPRVTPTATT